MTQINIKLDTETNEYSVTEFESENSQKDIFNKELEQMI